MQKGFIVNKIHLILLLDIKGKIFTHSYENWLAMSSCLLDAQALPTSSGIDAADYKKLRVTEHPTHILPITLIFSVCVMMMIIRTTCQCE